MKEFTKQTEFVEYLKSLKGEKPFNCDYLKVLSEAVFFNHHIPIHKEYNEGDLMCIKSIETKQSALINGLCENFYFLKLKNKKLEIKCNNNTKFNIKINPAPK